MGGIRNGGRASMKIGKAVLSVGLLVIAGLGSSVAQGTNEGRFSKIHFRAGTSLLVGNSAPALSRNLTSWGFGDDRRIWALFWSIPSSYPKVSNRARFDLQLEYSITRTIGLGLAVSSLANASGKGYDLLGILDDTGATFGNSLHVSVRGTAYFLSASYMPPPRSGQRFSPRVGLGVGVSDIEVAFETNIRGKVLEGKPLYGLAFVGLDCWLLRNWTIGVTLQYRYVPFRPGAFEISAEYGTVVTYQIPVSDYGLGGVDFGINMGLHF
jgi:opacity protein-like surface antigen